jgi:hypothetical protein
VSGGATERLGDDRDLQSKVHTRRDLQIGRRRTGLATPDHDERGWLLVGDRSSRCGKPIVIDHHGLIACSLVKALRAVPQPSGCNR